MTLSRLLPISFLFVVILHLVGEKPEQGDSIQTEDRNSASSLMNPMTFDEIQHNISCFPEVIIVNKII